MTKFNTFIFLFFSPFVYFDLFRFSIFVHRSCHIFPYYHFKHCNRHFYYFSFFINQLCIILVSFFKYCNRLISFLVSFIAAPEEG